MIRWIVAACVVPVWAVAQDMRCLTPPFDGDADLHPVKVALAQVEAIFPRFAAALDTDVAAICLTDRPIAALGYFEPDTRSIHLDATLPAGLQMAVFFHELRHAQQFAAGACPQPALSMADYAEAVFAMEADASVASFVAADALRRQGVPQMWAALQGWPMQSGIGTAYETALADGGDIGAAASAAFEAWYDNPDRREAYYLAACSDYLDEVDRSHRIPTYDRLPPDYFAALCRLPDGRRYACSAPD